MRIAIMQPYFLPYLGYWQLLGAVDRFVVYDNIEYTKKGWINRNRMLQNGNAEIFTIPVANAPDNLHVGQRSIAESFAPSKLLNKFANAYRKAPNAQPTLRLLSQIIHQPERNLFRFILTSIEMIAATLGIGTPITISSTINIDHTLRAQSKVIAICKEMHATTYINPPGGIALYDHAEFLRNAINLQFIQPSPVKYDQLSKAFVENLSIVDVMMFNDLSQTRTYLTDCFSIS
jgi:hypothetical protein